MVWVECEMPVKYLKGQKGLLWGSVKKKNQKKKKKNNNNHDNWKGRAIFFVCFG